MTSNVQHAPNGNGTALALMEPIQAPALITDTEIDRTFRVAKALAMSGMFRDAFQAEQAFAKILIGRDLGLSPTQAMMNLHIVEGKPELSANLQAAFVKRAPGYDYRVLEHTETACEIVFTRDGEELGKSRFTIEDARTAGLVKDKSAWTKYPRNMLFARALSNGVAFHCPEVTAGIRVYSEGEISEQIGEVVDAAPAEPPTAEPVDAIVVEPTEETETLEPEDAAKLLELIALGKSECDWNDKRVAMTLGAYGAKDITTIESAIATFPPEGVPKFEEWTRDCVNAALDARLAAEAEAAEAQGNDTEAKA